MIVSCTLFGFHNPNLKSSLFHGVFGHSADLGFFLTVDVFFYFCISPWPFWVHCMYQSAQKIFGYISAIVPI